MPTRSKAMRDLILFALSMMVLAACTKEIKPNLRTTSSSLVIEGNINNMPGPYTVQLSQTVVYYDSNNIIPVSGGRITISDNAGNRDSLIEVSPGVYHTTFIAGTVGMTYHLSVNSGGKQYDAYSTMNPAPTINSFTLVPAFFGKGKQAITTIQDPSGPIVYYNAVLYVNNIRSYRAEPVNSQFSSGIMQQIQMRSDSAFVMNDTLRAEVDAIDLPMYNYWYSLNNSTLSTQTAAPANPISNISNNAFGYFSAYAATRSGLLVTDSTSTGFHMIP